MQVTSSGFPSSGTVGATVVSGTVSSAVSWEAASSAASASVTASVAASVTASVTVSSAGVSFLMPSRIPRARITRATAAATTRAAPPGLSPLGFAALSLPQLGQTVLSSGISALQNEQCFIFWIPFQLICGKTSLSLPQPPYKNKFFIAAGGNSHGRIHRPAWAS